MSLICPTCGKNFTQTSTCERHIRSVHEHAAKKGFICSLCKKVFKRRDNLQTHMDSIHLKKGGRFAKQKCPWPLCNYYCLPGNLRIHMAKIHVDDRKPEYSCSFCALTYYTRRAVISHERQEHGAWEEKTKKVQDCGRSCPLCDFISVGFHKTVKEIMFNHFRKEHNVVLNWEKWTFDTLNDFYDWKQGIENSTSTSFISIYNGDLTKNKKDTKLVHTFVCNRNRLSRSKKCVKTPVNSVKAKPFCPAAMQVKEGINSEIQVAFLNVHLGHKTREISNADYGKNSINKERKISILKVNKIEIDSDIESDSLSFSSDQSDEERFVEKNTQVNDRKEVSNLLNDHTEIEHKFAEHRISIEQPLKEEIADKSSNEQKSNPQDVVLSDVEIKLETFQETQLLLTEDISSATKDNLSDGPVHNELVSSQEQVCDGAVIAVETACNLTLAHIFKDIKEFQADGKLQRIQLTVSGQSKDKKYLYINNGNTSFSKFEEVASSVVIKINEA